MPAETRTIHYRAVEFLYRNWHYSPGWYFYDEEEDLYGPFTSWKHCEAGLKLYLKQLMEGKSPTQLTIAEKRALTPIIEEAIANAQQYEPEIPDDILTDLSKH